MRLKKSSLKDPFFWLLCKETLVKFPCYYVSLQCQNTNFNFSRVKFSTKTFHNSTNTGPIDKFFTKKVTFFHGKQDGIIHFCLSPNERFFWQFEWSWVIEFGKVHHFFVKNLHSKCQNTHFIGTETKMNGSLLLHVKSSYIFW